MLATSPRPVATPSLGAVAVRLLIVGLTLTTAWIHSTLGGLLFLANAAGYATLAAGMIVPFGPIARNRGLVRLALIGFTAATIVGWILFGARYSVAYLDKAVEAILVGLLVQELYRIDGGPLAVIRRSIDLGRRLLVAH